MVLQGIVQSVVFHIAFKQHSAGVAEECIIGKAEFIISELSQLLAALFFASEEVSDILDITLAL